MAIYDYSSAIKLTFDKEIVVDPEIVSGTTVVKKQGETLLKSIELSPTEGANDAVDGNLTTYWWATALPCWIGYDYGSPTSISKVRLYNGTYANYRVTAYSIQWSDNGSSWTTIASGTCPNQAGWNEVTFTEETHRYWRLYITSSSGGSYITLFEVEFHGTQINYNVFGWDVYATEQTMIPGGTDVVNHYTVKKITWGDTHYEIILWLNIRDRMMYPKDLVTVSFTGVLIGDETAFVAPFVATFTPTNIMAVFNPNDAEYIQITNVVETTNLLVVHYASHYQQLEHINITDVASTAILMDISGIPV